jgi:hypothetical protein
MALSTTIKTTGDGSIILSDGTGTPLTLAVRFSNGDVNIGGLTNSLREVVTIVARMKTVGLRKGAPVYPTIAFSCYLTDLGEATSGTILNWEAKTAPYASRLKTHAIGDLDTYHIKLTIEGTDHGDAADQNINCKDCHGTWTFTEEDGGNKAAFSGVIYGDVVLTDAGAQATTFTAPR